MYKLCTLISSISLISILNSCIVYEETYSPIVESKGIVIAKDKVRTQIWPSSKDKITYIKSELEGIITHNVREVYNEVEIGDSVLIYTIKKNLIGKEFGKERYNKNIEIQRYVKKIYQDK